MSSLSVESAAVLYLPKFKTRATKCNEAILKCCHCLYLVSVWLPLSSPFFPTLFWGVRRLCTHSGLGFPLASHVMGKISSKGKAMRELGGWAVIVGSCSTEKQTNKHTWRLKMQWKVFTQKTVKQPFLLNVPQQWFQICFWLNLFPKFIRLVTVLKKVLRYFAFLFSKGWSSTKLLWCFILI